MDDLEKQEPFEATCEREVPDLGTTTFKSYCEDTKLGTLIAAGKICVVHKKLETIVNNAGTTPAPPFEDFVIDEIPSGASVTARSEINAEFISLIVGDKNIGKFPFTKLLISEGGAAKVRIESFFVKNVELNVWTCQNTVTCAINCPPTY